MFRQNRFGKTDKVEFILALGRISVLVDSVRREI